MTKQRRDSDDEPARDARLGEQLRDAERRDHERVDWDALGRRIMAAARAQETPRGVPAWHAVLARWSRAAVPVAVAAGIAALIAIRALLPHAERRASAPQLADSAQMLVLRSPEAVRVSINDPESFLSEVISR